MAFGGLNVLLRIRASDMASDKLKTLRGEMGETSKSTENMGSSAEKLEYKINRMGYSMIFAGASAVMMSLQSMGLIDKETALGKSISQTMGAMQLMTSVLMLYSGWQAIAKTATDSTTASAINLRFATMGLGLAMGAIALTFYTMNMEEGKAKDQMKILTTAVWAGVAAWTAYTIARTMAAGPAAPAIAAAAIGGGAAVASWYAMNLPKEKPEDDREAMKKQIIKSKEEEQMRSEIEAELGYPTTRATRSSDRYITINNNHNNQFYNSPRENSNEVAKKIEEDSRKGYDKYYDSPFGKLLTLAGMK